MNGILIQIGKLKHGFASASLKKKVSLSILVVLLLAGIYAALPFQGAVRLLLSGNQSVYANLPILFNGDDLKVHVIDVGQGDATLIEYQSVKLLIDTGPPEADLKLANYLKGLGIARLDVLILTHPHDDHVGGGSLILENFSIGRLLVPHEIGGNHLLESVLRQADLKGIPVSTSLAGTALELSDLTLTCLHPRPIEYSNINNYSSVWTLQYKALSFLFLADLESDESDALPLAGISFVRSGHHGSVTSTTKNFLDKLDPGLFAISCGLNNSFGHPSKEVISLLTQQKIKYFRTDRSGTRVISSDGSTLRWVH